MGSGFSAWHCWLSELGIIGSQGHVIAVGSGSTSICMQAVANLHKTRTHRDVKPGNVMLCNWDTWNGPDVTLIDWATSCSHEGTYVWLYYFNHKCLTDNTPNTLHLSLALFLVYACAQSATKCGHVVIKAGCGFPLLS